MSLSAGYSRYKKYKVSFIIYTRSLSGNNLLCTMKMFIVTRTKLSVHYQELTIFMDNKVYSCISSYVKLYLVYFASCTVLIVVL